MTLIKQIKRTNIQFNIFSYLPQLYDVDCQVDK